MPAEVRLPQKVTIRRSQEGNWFWKNRWAKEILEEAGGPGALASS